MNLNDKPISVTGSANPVITREEYYKRREKSSSYMPGLKKGDLPKRIRTAEDDIADMLFDLTE
jgi:hypothetical protein